MIKKLILKYFPSEERFWEVFRFPRRRRMLRTRIRPSLHTDRVWRPSSAVFSADRLHGLAHIELLPLRQLCLPCRASEPLAGRPLRRDIPYGTWHQSGDHVDFHRPCRYLVHVCQSHRFGHRHDLELLHQTLHSAPLIMIRK